MAAEAEVNNRLVEIKKYFTKEGEVLTTAEFKEEWEKLSEEEKIWFKTQPLK